MQAALSNHTDLIAQVLAHAGKTPEKWLSLPLGKRLRWLRIRLGLRQWQAAQLAEMTQSQIAKIENGLDLRLSTLQKLMAGYGCNLLVLPTSEFSMDKLRQRTEKLFPERNNLCPRGV